MTVERTRIKFCGMTRLQDVDVACRLGVDAVGLIFAARSVRRLQPDQAAQIVARLPPLCARVALFMDGDATLVAEAIDAVRPQWLQFHGSETLEWCESFAVPYLKAIPMKADSLGYIEDAQAFASRYPSASGFVLDAHASGEAGGSGQRFDWSRTPQLDRPWLLAGGLGPDNVAEAIQTLHPFAVDVSSGIESAPGIKDVERMRRFVAEVRRADEQQHRD